MEVFTIVRVGWEYNDENHYRGEGGGHPMTAYRDREKAEAKALELNIAEYRMHANNGYYGLASYLDEYEHGLSEEEIKEFGKVGVKIDDGLISFPSDISDNALIDLIRALGVVFYEITPVEFVE